MVQLYIRDLVSSVTRPVKELKGFQKVRLEPGETTTVAFNITPALLSFYDINMKYVVEPGDFELMVGTSSRATSAKEAMLSACSWCVVESCRISSSKLFQQLDEVGSLAFAQGGGVFQPFLDF